MIEFRTKEEQVRLQLYVPKSYAEWMREKAESLGTSVCAVARDMIEFHKGMDNVDKSVIKGDKDDKES